MTGYLAGLVARGLGRTPGPALEPRLGPEILSDSRQPPAPPLKPAPVTVGEVVEERAAVPQHARVELFRVDPASVNEARPDPPRFEAPRTGRRSRAAEPAPPRKGAQQAEPAAAQPASAPRAPEGSPSPAVTVQAAELAGRPERQQIVHVAAAPVFTPPPVEERHLARPLVQLLPREAAEPSPLPAPSAPAASHVEVRIGRVEVRAPRAPEPWRPAEPASVLREAPADPFARLAAARRYVDRAWR